MDYMEGPIKIDLSNVNHLNLASIFKIDFKCYFVCLKTVRQERQGLPKMVRNQGKQKR
jgi:hypothetical protein